MLYAIGDIHGCARELNLLLKQIAPKPNDTVVFLGDYIDRGPDSKSVIDLILALKKKTNVVALKGNHEQLFLDFLESPESPGAGLFILNGGGATLASYAGPGGSFEIPEEHIDFFYSLKTSFETSTHFFVHAGVPLKPLSELDADDEMKLLWIRQPFLSSDFEWEKIIVHGHTPVATVENRSNRVNLDTGCVYKGSLSAIELPTERVISVPRLSPESLQPADLDLKTEPRIAVRFSGRLPVEITTAHAARSFETLNFNQFGLLMRERLVSPGDEPIQFAVGQSIKGVIGPGTMSRILFEGTIARIESKNSHRLYGVSFTRVTNGNDGREWIERPLSAPEKKK